MNNQDPLSESTASALRAPLPGADPRRGFEARLMADIDRAPEPKSSRPAQQWLLAGLGAAVLVAALSATLLRPEQPTRTTTIPEDKPKPALVVNLPNPLEDELTAFSDSATRIGRFLISRLPSLPLPEEETL